MPKTQTPTPEQLREQAEDLARQAAVVQEALDRASLEEYEREQAAQAERDQATVANYNRAELDQAVDQARAALEKAVADWPVTKALAAYIHAGYRRNWAHQDLAAARSRLGMPEIGNPPSTHVEPLHDVVTRAATNAAQAAIDAERNQA